MQSSSDAQAQSSSGGVAKRSPDPEAQGQAVKRVSSNHNVPGIPGGAAGGGATGGGGFLKPGFSLVYRAGVLVAVVAVTLLFVYGAGPYVLPTCMEGEMEKAMAELASCRRDLSTATSELRSSNGGAGQRRWAEEEGAGKNSASEDKRLEERVRELEESNEQLRALLGAKEKEQESVQAQGSPQITKEATAAARELLDGCNKVKPARVAEGGQGLTEWKGYECEASKEELDRYLGYKVGGMCPNDWYFVQRLIFKYNCFSLPRRRCITVTPAKPSEPLALPDSLFSQEALKDENVRWDLHQCKSFECLNTRTEGDCGNCFNMTLESHRWRSTYRGGLPMKQVLAFKKGSIRLGLDVGGGTGSFAAHMALHGVTVVTTAFNVETVYEHKAGLPYMETIALRGVLPLHWPHKARLPFFDGILDIVHSVNSIKYIAPVEFQELIYEGNRVLRAGGLLWFEMFYAPVTEMPTYVAIIEKLGYRKLYWNFTPKPDKGEVNGEHVYLNCVLEKLPTPGEEVLQGPPEEDMKDIV